MPSVEGEKKLRDAVDAISPKHDWVPKNEIQKIIRNYHRYIFDTLLNEKDAVIRILEVGRVELRDRKGKSGPIAKGKPYVSPFFHFTTRFRELVKESHNAELQEGD